MQQYIELSGFHQKSTSGFTFDIPLRINYILYFLIDAFGIKTCLFFSQVSVFEKNAFINSNGAGKDKKFQMDDEMNSKCLLINCQPFSNAKMPICRISSITNEKSGRAKEEVFLETNSNMSKSFTSITDHTEFLCD